MRGEQSGPSARRTVQLTLSSQGEGEQGDACLTTKEKGLRIAVW
jgi:hypothetical protein